MRRGRAFSAHAGKGESGNSRATGWSMAASFRDSARCSRLLGLVGLTVLSAVVPACQKEFDTSRTLPARGSVGEEMYGVICDRLAAGALREDLTGASFHDVCHRSVATGEFATTVDQARLPPLDPNAVNKSGYLVPMEEQEANRAKAVGRVEALARRREDLVRALDATFPATSIPIKDIDNPDPSQTCNAPAANGEGLLTDAIADMLGRMTDLYNDGTVPDSTRSLAKVIDNFRQSEEAQGAWARLSGRQGYRPIDTALGAARPIVAYPNLRDLANSSLRLLSADSDPYQLNPVYDDQGRRIPVPGPANAAFNKLLEAGHLELLNTTIDPAPSRLVISTDPRTGRPIVSRPRDNIEMMQAVLFQQDDAFSNGPPQWIVKRDVRGYAALSGGKVPGPFVDANDDGLPDVDDQGRFLTANNSLVPSPFPFSGKGNDGADRDEFGRVKIGSGLLYDYLDTSKSFGAHLLTDLRPLVNPDPAAQHETLMDLTGGLYVAVGPREPRTKNFPDGSALDYSAVSAKSPLLDLVYAAGVLLGDRSTDGTLALARELFASKQHHLARLVGAGTKAMDISHAHPEAKIPADTTFWDDIIETLGDLVQEPGLLEDLLRALGDPATARLGTIFSNYMAYRDVISYDRNNINGPTWNFTTNSQEEMKTPVDRTKPETGDNQSAVMHFLGIMSDTDGAAFCNKDGAVLHARGVQILGNVDVPSNPLLAIVYGSKKSFRECEVIKIDNMADFYALAIAGKASVYLRDKTLREGLGGVIGAADVHVFEESAGITGFWGTGGDLRPKPEFLARQLFFDQVNDSPNEGDKNYITNRFLKDLQGTQIGTTVCPERIIDDPMPNAPDASPDGKVHGLRSCQDGQWLPQRQPYSLFYFEQFGFLDAIRPVIEAFAAHGKINLFVKLAAKAYKHLPDANASAGECLLPGGNTCKRSGANSYEPLLSEVLKGDLLPAFNALSKELDTLVVKKCEEVDDKGQCTLNGTKTVSGVEVVAEAVRHVFDPNYAKKTLKLTDRFGNAATKRNDGSPVAQVTLAHLVANAMSAIDDAFATYGKQHPEDPDRLTNWRRARSQLVDQFVPINGEKENSSFANPTTSKIVPVILDLLHAQLAARCPTSFGPPYDRCEWAMTELPKKAEETLTGPLFGNAVDVIEALRKDPESRKQMQLLLQYLVDSASANDALPSTLASMNDILQVMHDDENLVPLYHLLASAMNASVKDDQGHIVEKSLVDAQMALLARIAGRYHDESGLEICSREIDPNQVLTAALSHFVTPIKDDSFQGQSPMELVMDVIADVNRIDPTQPYEGTLPRTDYVNVSDNVVDFLMNKERGLEQFYEVIRQGTQF